MVIDPNECTFQSRTTTVNSFNSNCATVRSNSSTSTIRVTHYILSFLGRISGTMAFDWPTDTDWKPYGSLNS